MLSGRQAATLSRHMRPFADQNVANVTNLSNFTDNGNLKTDICSVDDRFPRYAAPPTCWLPQLWKPGTAHD